jgi:hypothetical protein
VSATSTVRELLRERGPLTADDLLEMAQTIEPIRTKNPKQTVRNALQNSPGIEPMGDGRWVYLPAFIAGAQILVSMDFISPGNLLVSAGVEVDALLWPTLGPYTPRSVTLDGGAAVEITMFPGLGSLPYTLLRLPDTFWRWWAQVGDPGEILLSCQDGEAGRYCIRAAEPRDETTRREANSRLEHVARSVVRRSQGACFLLYFARRLLATGVYHRSPLPDPSPRALFGPGTSLRIDVNGVIDLSQMTGAARKRAEAELEDYRQSAASLLQQVLGLPQEAPPAMEPAQESNAAELDADTYRLRVRLKWMPGVWRTIELTGDRTLHDLHLAIQDAFGWDNDHLYSFFISGKRWDRLTEIPGPVPFEDYTGTSANVTVGELEVRPGQEFLYLFDYGDQLEHAIRVLGVADNPSQESFLRITEAHGEAPPQYPDWEPDEEE